MHGMFFSELKEIQQKLGNCREKHTEKTVKNAKFCQKHKKNTETQKKQKGCLPPPHTGGRGLLKSLMEPANLGKKCLQEPPPRGGRSKGWVQPAAAFE